MAALAYVLLPVSGAIAFLKGRDERVRAHGVQALVLGIVWPAALYVASVVGAPVTRAVFLVGAVAWVALVATAASGRDLLLQPARRLAALTESGVTDER